MSDDVSGLKKLRQRDRQELAMLSGSIYELLWRLPVRHQDRRRMTMLRDMQFDEEVMLLLRVVKVVRFRTKVKRRLIWKVTLTDGVQETEVTFFNPAVNKLLRPDVHVVMWGRVAYSSATGVEIRNPQFDVADDDGAVAPFMPVYRGGAGLHPRRIRTVMDRLVQTVAPTHMEDPVPLAIRSRRRLPTLREAMCMIHQPGHGLTERRLDHARRSLAYTEAWLLAAGMRVRRRVRERETECPPIEITDDEHTAIIAALGFPPTPDQRKAIDAIRRDLAGSVPVRRLLQGDVGSGKTAVATYALMACAMRDHQAALLAPTEILARQHNVTIRRVANRLNIASWVLLGSTAKSRRRLVLNAFENDFGRVLVGTHAILEPSVKFCDLRLVIIDEQHKFGVVQRQRLIAKARAPHVVSSTATPIPRTLTLAMHGDLDVSIIRTKPPGRGAVATRLVHNDQWDRVVALCCERVRRREQVYIVCPVVSDSADDDGATVEDVARRLEDTPLKTAAGGIVRLHGRMSTSDKEAAMDHFAAGVQRAMVCSTVVEVGVDVSTATVMVVLDADRFGLTQLHQLRGRVGRGARGGICILMTGQAGGSSLPRLKTLCATEDGFVVAEADLKLRGSGEWFAERQHGSPNLRVLNLDEQSLLVEQAFEDLEEAVESGSLDLEELRGHVIRHFGDNFTFTGADGG